MSFKICRNENNFILKYVGIRIIQVAVASEMKDEDSFIQKKKNKNKPCLLNHFLNVEF